MTDSMLAPGLFSAFEGDSHLSAFSESDAAFENDSQVNIEDWTVDSVVGADLALDDAGFFIHVLTSGLYLVQSSVLFHNNNGATHSFWDVYAGNEHGEQDNTGTLVYLDIGANGVSAPIDSQQGGMSHTITRFRRPGSLRIMACPIGGSDTETINFAGMDIVKIG